MPKYTDGHGDGENFNVRLSPVLRAKLDRMHSGTGLTRAEIIRYLIASAPEVLQPVVVTEVKPLAK
jgi:hypothetical protein